MKVLFLMNGSFSCHSTSEHLLEAIILQLASNGNQVHVIQMLKETDKLTLPDTIKELAVTTEAVYIKPQNKTNFVVRYLNVLKNYAHCKCAIKRNSESDAVFLQSTNGAGFAVKLVRKYLRNAVITYNVQDIFPYNLAYSGKLKKNGIVFKTLAGIQRYGYRNSDHIITISEDMKDTLISDGIPSEKIEVVYNWSYQDEPYENIDTTRVSHMFDNKYFNVVYAGNIGVMQNVDILVEAAKLMKDDATVWFHIIGDGVYKEKLIARAKDYEISNISFWPMQPPELAPLIYHSADVNVIPLVKNVYRTALPSKTATCLACQKPIIFAIGKKSKFGNKVMNEADCVVVESDDPSELRDSIYYYKNNNHKGRGFRFYQENCLKTYNSKQYANIITEGCMR